MASRRMLLLTLLTFLSPQIFGQAPSSTTSQFYLLSFDDWEMPRDGTPYPSGLLIANNAGRSTKTGTVCDDSFNKVSGDVICKDMGYAGGAVEFKNVGTTTELQRNYEIALDDVVCSNRDGPFEDCRYSTSDNCGHSEDIVLTCQASAETAGSFYMVDLVTGESHDGTGLGIPQGLLIANRVGPSDKLGTVCDSSGFNMDAAHIICKGMGFVEAVSEKAVAYSSEIQDNYEPALYKLSCTDEDDVSFTESCQRIAATEDQTCDVDQSIVLTCRAGRGPNSGSFYLVDRDTGLQVDDGIDYPSGLLIADFIGTSTRKGTVCDDGFDKISADLICKEMGYAGGAVSFTNADGSTNTNIQRQYDIALDNVECFDRNDPFDNCRYLTRADCGHSEDIILTCQASAEPAGSFYLVDLETGEGIFSDTFFGQPTGLLIANRVGPSNKVGTVCDSNVFNMDAAHLICKGMGFVEAVKETNVGTSSEIQDNYEPALYKLICTDEDDVSFTESCQRIAATEDQTCHVDQSIVLTCVSKPLPRGSSFYLMDLETGLPAKGDNPSGLLIADYVGSSTMRGTVCDDNWSDSSNNVADVICQDMGYERSVSWNAVNTPIQKMFDIALDSVRCRSLGPFLDSCTYTTRDDCGHAEDVFLSCYASACATMPEGSNLELSPALPINAGESTFVSCPQYYHLEGATELHCVAGDLRSLNSAEFPNCERNTCSDPESLGQNLVAVRRTNTLRGMPIFGGDVIEVECREGYELEEKFSNEIVCNQDNLYTPNGDKDFPRCIEEILECDALPSIMRLVETAITFPVQAGDLVPLRCPEYYTLMGDRNIVCLSGTKYQFDVMPRCSIAECNSLPNDIPHLTSSNSFPISGGDRVAVKCEPGWEIVGSTFMTCLSGTNFQYENKPRCEEASISYEGIELDVCSRPKFKRCQRITLNVGDEPYRVTFTARSMRTIGDLDPNTYLEISGESFSLEARDFFVDQDLRDGTIGNDVGSGLVRYLELKVLLGPLTVTDGAYITSSPVSTPTRPVTNADGDLQAAYFVTDVKDDRSTPEPTEFVPEEAPQQVKELVVDNTIEFETKTSISGNDEEGTIRVWKPKFNGASIPAVVASQKAEEYASNRQRGVVNMLGYLTYNGFTDFGITKKKTSGGRGSKEDDQGSNAVDEDTMVEIIKTYQRFNGYPETGELTEQQSQGFSEQRCGNSDVSYVDSKGAFTCEDSEEVIRSGDKNVTCPDPEDKFDLCQLYPKRRRLILEGAYYLEADVEFENHEVSLTRSHSHLGIAYNYNSTNRTADYIYIKPDNNLQRMCFSAGTYIKGKRVQRRDVSAGCVKYNDDQKILRQFKIRINVERELVTFYVGGRRAFQLQPIFPIRSALFTFALSGGNFENNRVKIFTSRLCKRNMEYNIAEQQHEHLISKRYVLSNYRWYPNGDFITYAFVNHSSSLGEQQTREEILRAIETYSIQANMKFKELDPALSNTADIAFMFIKGAHADDPSYAFNGAGNVKAHAFSPVHGEIHFNDWEQFSVEDLGPDYTSLYFVALHELGHAMGLQHSEIKDAVMNAPYTGSRAYATNNLDYDDISALRNHYFDEMRRSPLGVNQKMDGVILEDVDYHPRLPLPSRCHKNINAAFYLHNRPDITESIFLMTNGYLFRFKASNWFQKRSPMKGYPKRTSEYFPDAEGVIDAAFDTGSRVYFIIGSRVLVYSVEFKFETEIIKLEEDGTLESIFGAKVSNSNKITAAFNHVKKIGCSKGKEVCVETTLVVSPSMFFVLKWSKFGKKLNSVQQITSPTQMVGHEVPETQFQAAFEWFREGQLEVMQFDTSKSARTRVPFPQNAQTRTSSNDVPTTFGIAGWCIT